MFERNCLCAVFDNGSRKQIPLNRILVADRSFSYFRVIAGEVGAVMNKDSRWPVGRRVEGNLDFESSACPAELHTLVRNQLSAAGKGCLPGREVQNCRSQPINAQIGVSFDQSQHASWFSAKNESGQIDRVTADVHQSSAADFGFVANVCRVAIKVAKEAD